jgi:hypothetical protein
LTLAALAISAGLLRAGTYTGPGTNNLGAPPLFANTTNYLVSANSPCIDAGDPGAQFDDEAFPPSQGGDRNDLGAYGGPGAGYWPAFSASLPIVLVNGQPAAPYQVFTFSATTPPVISFANGYPGGTFQYTLDGSNPIEYPAFSQIPLVLSNSAQIRVLAFSSDFSSYAIAAPVTVKLVPGFSLTAGSAGGGGVSPPGGTFLSNTVATLTATNAPRWTFLNWAGDAAGTNTQLINAASVSGNTGANNSGNVGPNAGSAGGLYNLQLGSYQILLGPAPAVSAGAGWEVLTVNTNFINGAQLRSLAPGPYTVVFKPVAGYVAPADQTLTITANQTSTLTVNYTSSGPAASFSAATLAGGIFNLTLTATPGQQFALERSTNLVNWTAPATNTANANGVLSFTNNRAANQAQAAFYRAHFVP